MRSESDLRAIIRYPFLYLWYRYTIRINALLLDFIFFLFEKNHDLIKDIYSSVLVEHSTEIGKANPHVPLMHVTMGGILNAAFKNRRSSFTTYSIHIYITERVWRSFLLYNIYKLLFTGNTTKYNGGKKPNWVPNELTLNL